MLSGTEYILVALAAAGAGLVNALAGGGTLITFPAPIAVGIPPLGANLTNTVAVILRAHGLTVDIGVLETECRLLNQAFIKHAVMGLPFVTLKAAATLDGFITTRAGDSRWISNEQSRRFVHRLRCSVDSILVGINTAIADDPQLTARCKRSCRQPIRVVLDTALRLPLGSHLAKTAREVPVWVACGEPADRKKEQELARAGVEILRLPVKNGRVDLSHCLREVGKRQMTSLLVEGGGRVLGDFLDQGLADDFHFFYAPKILGDPKGSRMVHGSPRELMSNSLQAYDLRVRRFGQDVLLSGRLHETIY